MRIIASSVNLTVDEFANEINKSLNCTETSASKTKGLFLSFDKKAEIWKVVKLNLIERFLRAVFGAYKSTHLKTIRKVLNGNMEFLLQIRSIWNSKYPKKCAINMSPHQNCELRLKRAQRSSLSENGSNPNKKVGDFSPENLKAIYDEMNSEDSSVGLETL